MVIVTTYVPMLTEQAPAADSNPLGMETLQKQQGQQARRERLEKKGLKKMIQYNEICFATHCKVKKKRSF